MKTEAQAALFSRKHCGDSGPVECFGKTFENEEARRSYYRERLREYLRDPDFRRTPGFPDGSDEDILRLSDPPYYTACPNPFLEDFIRAFGSPFSADEDYHREPFAVDVSVGKTDQLYRAHGYHTKVPHLAIIPSILHYTRPGDIVLDGFCGSGMTGVAAQLCANVPADLRRQVEQERQSMGLGRPQWGLRRAVLSDLSPAASFITAGYNLPFDLDLFEKSSRNLLDAIQDEVGWMYTTAHTDGSAARINYTVWSEVFSCPECGGEIVFFEEALNRDTGRTLRSFSCPGCSTELKKSGLERLLETRIDPATGDMMQFVKLRPVLINYTAAGAVHEKEPDERDLDVIRRIEALPLPSAVPVTEFPYAEMWEAPRLRSRGVTRVHHLFLPRQAYALAKLWTAARDTSDAQLRRILLFFVEQAIWGMSILARYAPTHYSQVNQYLSGAYYVGSQIVDVSPWYILEGKADRLAKAFSPSPAVPEGAVITTGDCASLPLPDSTIDYVFTDPPFGDNFPYRELNFLVECWHGVMTDPDPEAVVDRSKADSAKQKLLSDYQALMRRCFEEYYRVLKPGRWITVVFSNSKNAVWRAIQEAIGTAGFVISDVRTLDKQQRTLKQLTSAAVKQDLVISAYKPSRELVDRFALSDVGEDATWAFVREHLGNVPVFLGNAEAGEIVTERSQQMLYDRMVAFFVQRGVAVPLGSSDFLIGLSQRYPERDGMYFLPEQVAEYDRRRTSITELRQLDLFVNDEASAIQWVRQQLQLKPRTFQDLQPSFMRELQAWAKHERTIELKEILDQNFLRYDGTGPVPGQIHGYLSTNYKDLRGLDKDAPRLVEKARDRWYVPDPNKQGDLEKLRERALLKEFEEYKTARKKLKEFRTEAVRMGFKAAYDAQDYKTIVDVANKIPESVLQEDEKLLMYYDVASMRLE